MEVSENHSLRGCAERTIDSMEIKKILPQDFREVAQSNEYYLWNFLQREQDSSDLTFWSVFDSKTGKKHRKENLLIDFLKVFPISYYESYVDESVDFLVDFGISPKLLFKVPENHGRTMFYKRETFYNPVVLLFKKYRMLDSTFNHCYCIEGMTEMLISNIPTLIENSKLD